MVGDKHYAVVNKITSQSEDYMWTESSILELYKACCLHPRFYYQEVLCLDKTYNLAHFFVTGFWYKNNAFAHNEGGVNNTLVMFGCALVHDE